MGFHVKGPAALPRAGAWAGAGTLGRGLEGEGATSCGRMGVRLRGTTAQWWSELIALVLTGTWT